ncbi:hypothetical protein ACFL38_03005 [Candidatus Omnitrophota bacterium]
MFRKKRGFLLLTMYMVLAGLSILSIAFFNETITHNLATQNMRRAIEAKAHADEALEHAYIEITSAGAPFITHIITQPSIDDETYLLTPIENKFAPVITVPDCEFDLDPESPTYGCYRHKDRHFAFKTYASPLSAHMMVHALGYSDDGTVSRLIISKIAAQNPYDYFLFSDTDYHLYGRNWLALGGTMHTNGSFILHDDVIIDTVGEFSAVNYIKYFVTSQLPWDEKGNLMSATPGCEDCPDITWEEYYYLAHYPYAGPNREPHTGESLETYDGGIWAEYAYKNNLYSHLSGNKVGLLNLAGHIWDPDEGNRAEPLLNPELYIDDGDGVPLNGTIATINGTGIVNGFWQLDQQYNVNPYWLPTAEFGYDPSGRPDASVSVGYLHTAVPAQSSALQSYCDDHGIAAGTIKDKYNGSEYVTPMVVDPEGYKTAAQTNGIYIYSEEGTTMIDIGPDTYSADAGGSIDFGGHTFAQDKSFIHTYSTEEKQVTEINLGELIVAGVLPGNFNGIVYADKGVVVDNADVIPATGLTWVSPHNMYLKGDYNTGGWLNGHIYNWSPSAIINAMDVYTLSDNFNYPQTLPVTRHHRDYPYEEDTQTQGGPGTRYNWLANVQDNPDYYDFDPMGGGIPPKGTPETIPMYAGEITNMVDKGYAYNVSLIGNRAYEPKVLERWSYFTDPGDINTPPSGNTKRIRTITGSKIKINAGYFPSAEAFDEEVAEGRGRTYADWPKGGDHAMCAVEPYKTENIFQYETDYADQERYPPGQYINFIPHFYIEKPSDATNFNYYNTAFE